MRSANCLVSCLVASFPKPPWSRGSKSLSRIFPRISVGCVLIVRLRRSFASQRAWPTCARPRSVLAGFLIVTHRKNLEFSGSAGSLKRHALTGSGAQQRTGEGRLITDPAALGIDLVDSDYPIPIRGAGCV